MSSCCALMGTCIKPYCLGIFFSFLFVITCVIENDDNKTRITGSSHYYSEEMKKNVIIILAHFQRI